MFFPFHRRKRDPPSARDRAQLSIDRSGGATTDRGLPLGASPETRELNKQAPISALGEWFFPAPVSASARILSGYFKQETRTRPSSINMTVNRKMTENHDPRSTMMLPSGLLSLSISVAGSEPELAQGL